MKLSLSRLAAVRPDKTWLTLGAALLIGLVTAFVARDYLRRQIAALEAGAARKSTALLVAKNDLAAGDVLSVDSVAVRQIPRDYAHSNAITPDDFERIEGQSVERALKSGDTLLWSLMQTRKAPTFSSRIEVGRRAITVQVDEINSISGLLEPGDAIDLMLTLEHNGKKTTFALLQNVAVMATGQRVADDPKSGERRQYSTVTLDTTREQAQSLIIAREAGKITALLRNPKDSQVLAGDSAAMAALLGQAGDVHNLTDAAGAAGRTVPVLYGGRQTGFKPEELRLAPIDEPQAPAKTAARSAPDQTPPRLPPLPAWVSGLNQGLPTAARSPASAAPQSPQPVAPR